MTLNLRLFFFSKFTKFKKSGPALESCFRLSMFNPYIYDRKAWSAPFYGGIEMRHSNLILAKWIESKGAEW